MFDPRNFKYLIPTCIYAVGSYLSYKQSISSAINFRDEAKHQKEYVEELRQVSIGNETHWSSKINDMKATVPLYDAKIAIDLGTISLITLTHYALGMWNTKFVLAPFIPYTISSLVIAYGEYTRNKQHTILIKELWVPECTTKSYKDSLNTASKIGASNNADTYSDVIQRMYKLEDATNYLQSVVILGSLWNKLKELYSTPTTATVITMRDTLRMPPASAAPVYLAPSTEELIAGDKRAIAVATASGNLPNIDATYAVARLSPSSSDPSPANTPIRRTDSDEEVIPSPNICMPTRGCKIPYATEIGIAIGSVATYVILENAYTVASYIESGVRNFLDSHRNTLVKEYVYNRETANQLVEIGIMQHQFEVCSVKNPEVTMQLVDTYTTDTCNEGDIFKNLIMGNNDCKFIDPAIS